MISFDELYNLKKSQFGTYYRKPQREEPVYIAEKHKVIHRRIETKPRVKKGFCTRTDPGYLRYRAAQTIMISVRRMRALIAGGVVWP